MPKRPPDRRAVLVTAGCVAVAAIAGPADAAPDVLHGTVELAGGASVPEGILRISLEGASPQDDMANGDTTAEVESDGKARRIDFALPAKAAGSSGAEIVVRLERADGWLLARGSAAASARTTVRVVLDMAMY